ASQGPGERSLPAGGHTTGLASSHGPHAQLPPPAFRVAATVARETLTPHAVSRHGQSAPRPSPVYMGASVSPSPSLSLVQAGVRVAVNGHAANRNCSTGDAGPVAGVTLSRLCTESSHSGQRRPHAGEW